MIRSMLILLLSTAIAIPARCEERIPYRDTCAILRAWQEPPAVPLPTLDHHLGKVTASVGLFSVLSLSGVGRTRSAVITSAVALTFELIQFLFFNETLLHSINDVVLFSYHWPEYFFLEREYAMGAVLTIDLTGVYLTLLTNQ